MALLRLSGLSALLITLLMVGCTPPQSNEQTVSGEQAETGPESEPSPAATAEPPTEESKEVGWRPPREETRAEFEQLMQYARENDLRSRPTGEVMQVLGEQLMGRPYIVGALDGFEEETLVARLDSLDCFTFVEAAMAMARGVKEGDYSFEGYLERTEEQRYRDGEADSYCSRMHYFTEWIHRNDERGLLERITAEAGGQPFDKQYGFMTAHREAYPQMAADSTFRCIADVEERLNEQVDLVYIPQDQIRASYDRLQTGDLVAMATHIDGLDVTHTGLVYKDDEGGTGLLHASTSGGVKVSPDLQEYVQGVDAQVGIIVARPLD